MFKTKKSFKDFLDTLKKIDSCVRLPKNGKESDTREFIIKFESDNSIKFKYKNFNSLITCSNNNLKTVTELNNKFFNLSKLLESMIEIFSSWTADSVNIDFLAEILKSQVMNINSDNRSLLVDFGETIHKDVLSNGEKSYHTLPSIKSLESISRNKSNYIDILRVGSDITLTQGKWSSSIENKVISSSTEVVTDKTPVFISLPYLISSLSSSAFETLVEITKLSGLNKYLIKLTVYKEKDVSYTLEYKIINIGYYDAVES